MTQATGLGTDLCECEAMAGERGSGPAPRRVHVIGPVCFDLVFSGLSGPPRPTVPRWALLISSMSPGGVANVAIALARLGL